MTKSTQAAAIERAIALRGDLELAAGLAGIPADVLHRATAIVRDSGTPRKGPTPR